jgi:hypothetical protein
VFQHVGVDEPRQWLSYTPERCLSYSSAVTGAFALPVALLMPVEGLLGVLGLLLELLLEVLLEVLPGVLLELMLASVDVVPAADPPLLPCGGRKRYEPMLPVAPEVAGAGSTRRGVAGSAGSTRRTVIDSRVSLGDSAGSGVVGV